MYQVLPIFSAGGSNSASLHSFRSTYADGDVLNRISAHSVSVKNLGWLLMAGRLVICVWDDDAVRFDHEDP